MAILIPRGRAVTAAISFVVSFDCNINFIIINLHYFIKIIITIIIFNISTLGFNILNISYVISVIVIIMATIVEYSTFN